MRSTITVCIFMCVVSMNALTARAADSDFGSGPYAGIGLGASNLDVQSKPSRTSRETDNGVLKIYGGYQFTENLGVEAGYIRSGQVKVTDSIDGVDVTRVASTRAAYVVATGGLPLGTRFTFTARLGMSYGDVNEGDVAPIPNTIYGSKTSMMVGAGARYALSNRMSLSLDVDHVGNESRQVSADVLTLTFRHSF